MDIDDGWLSFSIFPGVPSLNSPQFQEVYDSFPRDCGLLRNRTLSYSVSLRIKRVPGSDKAPNIGWRNVCDGLAMQVWAPEYGIIGLDGIYFSAL